jgi:hypothetical protein
MMNAPTTLRQTRGIYRLRSGCRLQASARDATDAQQTLMSRLIKIIQALVITICRMAMIGLTAETIIKKMGAENKCNRWYQQQNFINNKYLL